MNRVGFVGWRGMVGSVLMERMREEGDFDSIAEPAFFTTSQPGQAGPDVGRGSAPLRDAKDLEALGRSGIPSDPLVIFRDASGHVVPTVVVTTELPLPDELLGKNPLQKTWWIDVD